MVEAKHHESVGIGQNSSVYRLLEARLVNALEYGHGMASCFPGDLLKAERGAVE